MPHPRARPCLATVALVTLGLTAFLLLARTPRPAQAAPCQPPTYSLVAGTLSITGTGGCEFDPEDYRVYCSAGTVTFDYTVNGVVQGTTNTGIACSAPARLQMLASYGDDTVDLSAVSAASGFSGINQPNVVDANEGNDTVIGSAFADAINGGNGFDLIEGGPGTDTVNGGAGSDILRLRDGGADNGDCGADFDAVQADQKSLDSLANCEISDLLPATAKKKCKKRHGHKKCKKRRAAGR